MGANVKERTREVLGKQRRYQPESEQLRKTVYESGIGEAFLGTQRWLDSTGAGRVAWVILCAKLGWEYGRRTLERDVNGWKG